MLHKCWRNIQGNKAYGAKDVLKYQSFPRKNPVRLGNRTYRTWGPRRVFFLKSARKRRVCNYTISKCLSYITGFHVMSGDAEQTGSLFYIKRDLLTEMVLGLTQIEQISYIYGRF